MSDHVSPAATRPLDWYAHTCRNTGMAHDAAQSETVAALDEFWQQLMQFKNKREHFLGRSLLSPDVPKGLYLWGGVGRGKTFLMDGFYSCVPYQRKHRTHFHAFMADVHQRMKRLAAHDDPLLAVAEQIADSTRLLCLDEFHVDDIADAMILGRLLEALFAHGVVLMTTSNYAPQSLYPNGLQRQNFLPAIAMLERELRVLSLGTGVDHRLQTRIQEPRFFIPADTQSEMQMQHLFARYDAADAVPHSTIPAKKIARDAIWFDFQELCGGAHGQSDYLAIAHHYGTVFLSAIPRLAAEQSAAARRLTWLIDVLYDNRVQLVASSDVAPELLYLDGTGATEFTRTASRLIDMQSQRYRQLPRRNHA